MSFVIPIAPLCWLSVSVAVIVIVRIDSLVSSPLTALWAPVLRTFTSKLACICWVARVLRRRRLLLLLRGLLLRLRARRFHPRLHLGKRHRVIGVLQQIDMGHRFLIEIDDLDRILRDRRLAVALQDTPSS